MTSLETETVLVALCICAVTPWVLFGARIWKVSTAAKPKQAPQEKAGNVTAEMPAIFTDRKAS